MNEPHLKLIGTLSWFLCATAAVGCQGESTSKVKRWATEAEMAQAAPPLEGDAQAVDRPQATAVAEPPTPIATTACRVLIDRACNALGPYSDECQEVRALLPEVTTPAQRAGCDAILAAHVRPPPKTQRRNRVNPCRQLMRKVCGDLGSATTLCKQTRADASRLWRTGRGESCLGDLLLWEARQLLSGG